MHIFNLTMVKQWLVCAADLVNNTALGDIKAVVYDYGGFEITRGCYTVGIDLCGMPELYTGKVDEDEAWQNLDLDEFKKHISKK